MHRATVLYAKSCPDLRKKVCPGVRQLLRRLDRRSAAIGLVTGNLSRIAWTKMEHTGLKPYFRFGAFAEYAKDRAGLVRLAVRQALRERWIEKGSRITLISDPPNHVRAARANKVRIGAV